MGAEDDSAVISIANEDDEDLYENFYKYSDPKAAKRDYENFKASAEMSLDMKKGGKVKGYDDGGEVEEDTARSPRTPTRPPMRPKGGKTVYIKSGGKVSSASKRADGCAQRGKTRGRIV